MHKKSIWEQKWPKIISRKAYSRLNFVRTVSVPSSKLLLGGPRTPKIITKSRKYAISESLFHARMQLLQRSFCRAKRIHGESPWNYSRLELFLPSLGNTRRLLGGLLRGLAMTRRKRLRYFSWWLFPTYLDEVFVKACPNIMNLCQLQLQIGSLSNRIGYLMQGWESECGGRNSFNWK